MQLNRSYFLLYIARNCILDKILSFGRNTLWKVIECAEKFDHFSSIDSSGMSSSFATKSSRFKTIPISCIALFVDFCVHKFESTMLQFQISFLRHGECGFAYETYRKTEEMRTFVVWWGFTLDSSVAKR